MNRKTSITSAALSTCCTAFLHVNANLVKAMLNDMPFGRREAIDQLLKGGGSVGIEALVDQAANSTISSVGKPDAEGEEMRVVYETVFVSMPPDEQSMEKTTLNQAATEAQGSVFSMSFLRFSMD